MDSWTFPIYHERPSRTGSRPEQEPSDNVKELRNLQHRSAVLGFAGLGLVNVPAFAYLQGLKWARTLQAPSEWATWSSQTFLRRRLAWFVKATGTTNAAVKFTGEYQYLKDKARWMSVLSFNADSLPPLNHVWTIVAVNFVHFDLHHFLSNMVALYVAALTCVNIPGMNAGHVSAVTLASGITATASMLAQFRLMKTGFAKLFAQRCLVGASGVVSAFMALAALADPTKRVDIIPFLPGVVTMPNWFAAGSSVLSDVYGLLVGLEIVSPPASFQWNIGHAAHLGGTAVGILYYLYVLRPHPKRASVGVQTTSDHDDGDQEEKFLLLETASSQ